MSKCTLINKLLTRYGRSLWVSIRGIKTHCHALVMPARYKNKMYLDADVTDGGIMDNGRILYIGPAEPDFTKDWANTVISFDDKKFFVTRADMIYLGDKPLYIWAVLGNIVEV